MKNPTELMRQILQSEKAQEIIDYVSPIYGESYVGLWLYEAIGTVLDEIYQISEQLRYETTPATATLLLAYWERQYGIPTDTSLTPAQRQQRIISRIESRTAANPKVIASAVSAALNGAPVDITENVAPNTFRVNIRQGVPDTTAADAVINQMKPAHLIYQLLVALLVTAPVNIKIATAITQALQYATEVEESITPVGVYQVQTKLVVLFGVEAEQTGTTLAIS